MTKHTTKDMMAVHGVDQAVPPDAAFQFDAWRRARWDDELWEDLFSLNTRNAMRAAFYGALQVNSGLAPCVT